MSALDRKMLRDLWQMRGQALAICLVMACGVATFVMSLCTHGSLERTRQQYYDRHRFAHVFASLKRAPLSLLDRLAELPGVARVEARVVVDVTLDLPEFPEPVVARLLSLPDYGEPATNTLYLRRGRWVEPGRRSEALVSESFADAHHLQPGDRVVAVINGKRRALRIVGVVLSPEYIYQIRPGDILPDPKRFGLLWMNETELAAAFDLEGAFNDLSFRLMPGASEEETIRRIDQLTEPYGGLGAYPRNDQTSHRFINSEMEGLRGMAKVIPTIFLAVAAFLLNLVMSRLIATQREQIAALKAFGYGRLAIGGHYVKMVLMLVLVGALLGTALGAWLGSGLTAMYTKFFNFPIFTFHLDAAVVASGLLISGGAAVGGTLGSVWKAIKLPPAEAMRPEPPASFRPTVLERLGLQRFFSSAVRMVLRQMERQPIRTLFSMLGIATAVAVLVLGNFMGDSVEYVMDTQFHLTQRQDLTVTFVEPTVARVVHDLKHLPGVQHCETFRSVPVRLRFGPRSRQLGILGLDPSSTLYRLIDIYRHEIELPTDGLVLSRKLAELLAANVGDTMTVEVLEGERPVRSVPVVALVDDFSGTTAYMNRDALNRLMREGPVVSGAYLAADPAQMDELYRELKHSPRVAGVAIKVAALNSFKATVAENLLLMRFFNVLFACVIAFGVVYNTVRIALAERSRELATLRVIGFTRAEVSQILLGELAVLTVAAIPVGLVLGYGFAMLASQAQDTELFRIPMVIAPWTYGFAVVVTILAAMTSGLMVRWRIDHLDLIGVLKTKE